ncbi:MAG: hypothetical protein A2Y95_08385 [Deltaproteobacteria bacterium RBG_13_65_10]|nr:MAG: hypothetical protein A2Y95_08385 [Deltaproteobacteria bacterium RBG_13_65_10]
MAKTLKPSKPLRESLASHRGQPEEEIKTLAMRVQHVVEGREIIFFSLIVAVLLVFGGAGIYWFLKSNEASLAKEKLSVAYAAYREAVYPAPTSASSVTPPSADPATVAEKAEALARVAHEFPDSRAGAMASYLAGNAYLRADSPAKAVAFLRTAVDKLAPGDPVRPFAIAALGYALEDDGKADEALGIFAKLSALSDSRWQMEEALARARILRSQGKNKEAEGILAGLATRFPEQMALMGLGQQGSVAAQSGSPKITITPSGKVR